jgi:hypothetical protein
MRKLVIVLKASPALTKSDPQPMQAPCKTWAGLEIFSSVVETLGFSTGSQKLDAL